MKKKWSAKEKSQIEFLRELKVALLLIFAQLMEYRKAFIILGMISFLPMFLAYLKLIKRTASSKEFCVRICD